MPGFFVLSFESQKGALILGGSLFHFLRYQSNSSKDKKAKEEFREMHFLCSLRLTISLHNHLLSMFSSFSSPSSSLKSFGKASEFMSSNLSLKTITARLTFFLIKFIYNTFQQMEHKLLYREKIYKKITLLL